MVFRLQADPFGDTIREVLALPYRDLGLDPIHEQRAGNKGLGTVRSGYRGDEGEIADRQWSHSMHSRDRKSGLRGHLLAAVTQERLGVGVGLVLELGNCLSGIVVTDDAREQHYRSVLGARDGGIHRRRVQWLGGDRG
jgi:hypothetical protein